VSPARFCILLLGPLPIVAGSLAMTSWFRSDAAPGVMANRVLAADEQLIADEPPPGDTGAVVQTSYVEDATSPTAARLSAFLDDACRQAAERWRPQLGADCNLLVRPPFVLAGDLTVEQLEVWHTQTIVPAATALKRAYFQKSPTLPITIFLFSGEASYDHYARTLFGDERISVYGYYQPQRRALVMNIATGGGTLVHELTHALMDCDFPQVPDWFNEGLASLYEQCRFTSDGGIEGLPNWRLAGLQETIRAGRLGTLESLMTGDEFRGRLVGLNYAQARYFCLYLQERGLLEDFYRRLRADYERDPRGVAAARSLFDGAAWQTLDRDFQAWVLTLKF
jgi:hypothetical protein